MKFHKLTALGNDYIYFEGLTQKLPIKKIISNIVKISKRRFGIGSDGVILILPSETADAKMRIFNADASEAEMCGNGLRSVIKLLDILQLKAGKMKIETLAGKMEGEVLHNDEVLIKMNMAPKISAEKETTNSKDINFEFTRVDIGNPHAVIFVDDVKNFLVKKYGQPIEQNLKLFPNRTNVEFIKEIKLGEIEMRVWERGSGETLACGTGAAASSAVYRWSKGNSFDQVIVNLLGGKLKFNWQDNNFFMQGDAQYVYSGEIEL